MAKAVKTESLYRGALTEHKIVFIIVLLLLLFSHAFGHLMWRADSLEKTWCWEGQKAGGEEHHRGWDGWMASPTQWTWVWASSRRWWRTGRPGVLQTLELQRVGNHNTTTTCVWLRDPMDCSPLGSSVHGILQARILECVATSFSRGSCQPRDVYLFNKLRIVHFIFNCHSFP